MAEFGRELRRVMADTLGCTTAIQEARRRIRQPRIADTALGPARHDPQRMWIRYRAPVREVFAYAPPAKPDPSRPWRGYAIYPVDVLDKLFEDRCNAELAQQLAPLGIEMPDA